VVRAALHHATDRSGLKRAAAAGVLLMYVFDKPKHALLPPILILAAILVGCAARG